jgi:hypothetical protein
MRNGLPELIKNSKDQYARLGVTAKEDRQIVVIASANRRHVAVLDFGGAGEEDFAGWKTWSSRYAGRKDLADEIEAGHGNGGKAFMVRGSRGESFMCSSAGGLCTQMGFDNTDPALRYVPGYFVNESGIEICDAADESPRETLEALLRPLGTSIRALPAKAQDMLRRRNSFTLVVVRGVSDLVASSRRRDAVLAIPRDLCQHPQAAWTIESCQVWVLDGKETITTTPLEVEMLEPMQGFGEPFRFALPGVLTDPETDEEVRLADVPPDDQFLEVRVTSRQLRMSATKALNVIRVRNERNIVCNWSIADLSPMAGSAYLYGVLKTPAITPEHTAGADRQGLADTPLVRALRDWVAGKLSEIAAEIQRANADKEPESARQRANDVLEQLRDLMRQFLEAEAPGKRREGEDKEGPVVVRKRRFGESIDELRLEEGRRAIAMPVGVSIPLLYTCYDNTGPGKPLPVPRPAVRLVAAVPDVVDMPAPGMLRARKAGRTTIWLETVVDRVRSNSVQVTAADLDGAEVYGGAQELKQGQRVTLTIVGLAPRGMRMPGLFYETSVDQPAMGHFGRAGLFTAGGLPGEATARVKYGARSTDSATCVVRIGNEKVERPPGRSGSDIPLILLCGSEAPGREEYPLAQRTHPGGENYPTIIDFEPQWEDVIWVNHRSKESLRVRSGRGPSGAFGVDNKTFNQYLALKCFEILRRLRARRDLEALGVFTYQQLLEAFATAEIDAADFVDAAYQLVDHLMDPQVHQQKDGGSRWEH